MKQQLMNVYARFISDEPRTEAEREPAKPRRPAARVAASRSRKSGLKKRAGVPK